MPSPTQRPPIPLPDAAPLAVPREIADRAREIGVVLPAETYETIGAFLGLLLAMNEHMNLTAAATPDEVWTRHALDALTLLPLLEGVAAGGRVLDVGSGGGLPAIPLAIARPDLSFTLVESTQKKATFLGDVARKLSLTNVEVLAERAESVAQGSARGTYDVVTARAVARMLQLVGLTAPLARPGGRVLLVKGQRAGEEIAEARDAMQRAHVTLERTVDTPTGKIVVLTKSAQPRPPTRSKPSRRR